MQSTRSLKSHEPSDPRFWVIGGRHRIRAAHHLGKTRMRCDVVKPDGSRDLRVIPIDQLAIDPVIQIEWAYKEARACRYADNWDEGKCGPLDVVEIGAVSEERRAELKRGLDGDRRRVEHTEDFLIAVVQQEPRAVAIQVVLDETKWRVGESKSSTSRDGVIGSSKLLERMMHQLGSDGLRRALGLAARWRGEPHASSAAWIGALGLLVRDGYDEKLGSAELERMSDLVPREVLRKARGKADHPGNVANAFSEIHYATAGIIRKQLRLGKLPMAPWEGRAGNLRRAVP